MSDKSEVPDDFFLNVGRLFGTLNCVRIASDLTGFDKWLEEEHKITNFGQMFEGYKFFLESCIRSFLNAILLDTSLDIKEDFLFHRANFVGVLIHKVPNSCEKTTFVKHIVRILREISKAETREQLQHSVSQFGSAVLEPFDRAFDRHASVADGLKASKENALRYETMFSAFIFLNDLSKGSPHGHWVSILDNKIREERFKQSFSGYKYSLQFLWSRLLGAQYHSTKLVNMHMSRDWSSPDDDFFETKDRKPRGNGEDLDDFFPKIRDEVIGPIEGKLGKSLGFDKILRVNEKIPAESFRALLAPLPEPQLTEKERLECNLLWYQVDFRDSSRSSIFNGVPAFVSLFVGTAELVKIFTKGGDKALVCKFTHPDKSVNGNDFSYGVLISTAGSSGLSDYSGWMLFYDCCGDYSGFSGSEHAMAEAIMRAYKEKAEIEIVEMTIGKNRLKEYLAEKIISENQENVEDELEEQSRRRRERNVVAEARGLVVELLTYYTLTKSVHGIVDWNMAQSGNQLDIVVQATDSVTLIECVVDPSHMEVSDEAKKLRAKLALLNTQKAKSCIFWFWSRPTPMTIERLIQEGIDFEVLSELILKDPAWIGKKLNKLKTIFQA